jgi:hypothetical protein
MGLTINLIQDSSVSSAPSGFTQAVQQAASIYDATFSSGPAITVNITYGWGTYDNVANSNLNGTTESLGGFSNSPFVLYSTLKAR